MTPVLFVTNGHGEVAIARRIARELAALGAWRTEHLGLVGAGHGDEHFIDVGPQAVMPSGGLVAMGNVRAFAADVRAGFLALAGRQAAFMAAGGARGAAVVVAVGDIYALLFALLARRPVIFVGTAKSVYVAPYGPVERWLLRRARGVFVRDAATAECLVKRGVAAVAPGNVIADLLVTAARAPWPTAAERIALLPGSREPAYRDAVRLADIARRVARRLPGTAIMMSIAGGLEPARFGPALAGEPPIDSWPDDIGALLSDATLAIGQSGTANEAAAACGVPVVALARDGIPQPGWYRMRQARLLGEALTIVPADPAQAADAIVSLLGDRARRARMTAVGQARMGGSGGAATIARAIDAAAARAG